MASSTTAVSCNFCDQVLGGDRAGIAGKRGAICRDCIELCMAAVARTDRGAFEIMVQRARDFEAPGGG